MKTFNFVDLIVAPLEERIDHVAASHDIFSSISPSRSSAA